MRRHLGGAALLAGLWSLPAAAVNTETYQVPYFGAYLNMLVTDGARESDNGTGAQMVFGVPFDKQNQAIELRFFDYGFERADGKKDFQTGLFVDYVRDFGGAFGGMKPFLSGGVGFIEEDVVGNKHLHFGAAVGGGVMIPIRVAGMAVRIDGRVQGQLNDESYPNSINGNSASTLVDYHLGVGLQLPLTIFFDRPMPVEPAEECPIAVVDPVTGRSDCAVDSDRDGVADEVDQCPGTPPGTVVNRQGCARSQVTDDADADGVRDDRDQCASTQPGFKVDANGCVVAQVASFTGVTFEPSSARLTADGRKVLDGIAVTLLGQKELVVEIAGHTDNVGSQAYNLLLSQQRAEAVRNYLIERGLDEGRLTAVGYGQEEPVASNATEEGRSANRRVEFRVTTATPG